MDNILVENLHASPGEVLFKNNPTDVDITWVETLKDTAGNPVDYMLNLHPDSNIFFVENGKLTKRLTWQEDMKKGTTNRTKKVQISVKPKPSSIKSSILRLDVEDTFGFFDRDTHTLFYK